MTLQQELEAAKIHKMFVAYEAAIDQIIKKWSNGNSDVKRYIEKMSLTQEEFGRKVGIEWYLP